MARTRKPKIIKGPASNYAASNESIFEFSAGDKGGLISINITTDGTVYVDLYRLDQGVFVRTAEEHRA